MRDGRPDTAKWDADEGMVGVGDTIVSIFPLILRKGVEIGERA